MNIYEKLQAIKSELQQKNLKKTGENKFAKYKYYELADFLPTIVELCKEYKIFTIPSFTDEDASLAAINIEKPEEKIIITSPMRRLDLKGCNEVQALGGVETYQRRYLYTAMFDIVENDMFDGADPKNNVPKEYTCSKCGAEIKGIKTKDGDIKTAKEVYDSLGGLCIKCYRQSQQEVKQDDTI